MDHHHHRRVANMSDNQNRVPRMAAVFDPTSVCGNINRGVVANEGNAHRNVTGNSAATDDHIAQIKASLTTQPLAFIGFARAVQYLDDMRQLRGSDDFDSLVIRAECELHLGRGKQDDVMKKMAELIRYKRGPSLDEVLSDINKYHTSERPLAALVLRFLWCDLYDCSKQTPDVATEWIATNAEDVKTMTLPFITAGGRYRGIAIEFCMKKMEAMLESLRAKRNLDVDLALPEGKCILSLIQVYFAAKLYSKVIQVGLEGVRALALAMGWQVLRHCVYGKLLNWVGMAYGNTGKPQDAKFHFDQAKQACNLATDFRDEEEKKAEIDRAIGGVTEVEDKSPNQETD